MRSKASKYSLYESLGYLVYQASGSIRKRIGRELSRRGYPIRADQFSALVYIWDHDGQTQRVLAEKLYRDKTTVSRLVSKIESLGLIQRVSGQGDTREKLIYLTESGRDLMAKVTELVQEVLDLAEEGIDPQEMKNCKDVLRRVRQNLA
jgi:MarR family transcriptional regulator, organic hydroperoxide resistance regulator